MITKRIFVLGILTVAFELSTCLKVGAQGIWVLSNLDQPTLYRVGVAADAWLNARFWTGDNAAGYRLNSVHLSMGDPSGNPGGFSVALYEIFGTNTDNDLITQIGDLSGPDPVAEGVYGYQAYGIILAPSTGYSIVLTAETPTNVGSFLLNVSDTGDYTSSEEWEMVGAYDKSSNGFNWISGDRRRLQYAIYATPIPTLSIRTMPSGDEVEIRWTSVEGVPYQLQTRSSLSTGDWTDLGEPLTGDGSELTVTAPVVPGEAYFRVAVLPAE